MTSKISTYWDWSLGFTALLLYLTKFYLTSRFKFCGRSFCVVEPRLNYVIKYVLKELQPPEFSVVI